MFWVDTLETAILYIFFSGRTPYGQSVRGNGVHSGVMGGRNQMNGGGIGRSVSERTPGQRFNAQGQPGYSGTSGQAGYQNGNRTNRPIRRGVQI